MVSECCVLLNCMVLHCARGFYSVVIFSSTIILFGNAPFEKKSKRWGSRHDLLSQPLLDAISQAVVVTMEKRTYGRE